LFNVGQQFDFLTIQCDSWRVLQAGQSLAFLFAFALFKAVLRHQQRRRVDQNHPCITVNDDPVVLLNQVTGRPCAHHRRNVHAARHNGRVAGFATDIGHEASEHTLLELQHVGR